MLEDIQIVIKIYYEKLLIFIYILITLGNFVALI